MTNACCFSKPDLQLLKLFNLNLAEPVRMNAIVKAPTEQLILDWVFEVIKNFVDHLPACQISQRLFCLICHKLEAYLCQHTLGSMILISERFLNRLNQRLSHLPRIDC